MSYNQHFKTQVNRKCWDFPGGPVVSNPPCNAGDSIPGQGTKTPHAKEQLSPCIATPQLRRLRAATIESVPHGSARHNKRSCMPQLTLDAAKQYILKDKEKLTIF